MQKDILCCTVYHVILISLNFRITFKFLNLTQRADLTTLCLTLSASIANFSLAICALALQPCLALHQSDGRRRRLPRTMKVFLLGGDGLILHLTKGTGYLATRRVLSRSVRSWDRVSVLARVLVSHQGEGTVNTVTLSNLILSC